MEYLAFCLLDTLSTDIAGLTYWHQHLRLDAPQNQLRLYLQCVNITIFRLLSDPSTELNPRSRLDYREYFEVRVTW